MQMTLPFLIAGVLQSKVLFSNIELENKYLSNYKATAQSLLLQLQTELQSTCTAVSQRSLKLGRLKNSFLFKDPIGC